MLLSGSLLAHANKTIYREDWLLNTHDQMILVFLRSTLKHKGDQTFAAKLWNNLPLHIRTTPILANFQTCFKTNAYSMTFRPGWLNFCFNFVQFFWLIFLKMVHTTCQSHRTVANVILILPGKQHVPHVFPAPGHRERLMSQHLLNVIRLSWTSECHESMPHFCMKSFPSMTIASHHILIS